MSGHSKWHKIQHKKGKADKARSSVFTKLLRGITVAAQMGGGDPEMNFSLRLAVDKAKAANVPKDNIERAIKRGTGELKDGAILEEAVYEGFGPGGVALLIEAVTDNKNRTVSDVKHMLSKHGGSAAGPGSVKWQFERLGVVRFETEKKELISDWDSFELALINAGASDIDISEFGVEVQCVVENFKKIIDVVEKNNIDPDDSGLEWVAKETVEVEEEVSERVQNLVDILEELDDVKTVYTNEK